MVEGTVTKLTNFGAFVELQEGLEGLLHVSEIADRHVKDPSDELKVGDQLQVRILKIETDSRKFALSLRESSDDYEDYQMETASSGGSRYSQDGKMTLGDLVGDIRWGSSDDDEDDEDDS